jgi:hypothetical protein
MKNSIFAIAVLASLPCFAGTVFTTPVAERPDEPVLVAPMPTNWVEHPFTESNPEPDLTPEERRIGFMTFSRAITAPAGSGAKRPGESGARWKNVRVIIGNRPPFILLSERQKKCVILLIQFTTAFHLRQQKS